MASIKDVTEKRTIPINKVLISQPKPTSNRSPFFDLEERRNISIDWRPFIEVVPVDKKDFRRSKVNLADYTAIIFTSKNAVDFFFTKCEDLGITMSTKTKYFCKTEMIANYLQKYIVYRKRKIFFGEKLLEDILPLFERFKEEDKFLLPTSNLGSPGVVDFLNKNNIEFTEVMMFKTVSTNLDDLKDISYDMLVFFNPLGIKSLFENFPDFKQNDTAIAVFGEKTKKEAEANNLIVDIMAPTPKSPSIITAIDEYVEISNSK